jgi:hypothetical protein
VLLLLGAGLPLSEVQRRSALSNSELQKHLLYLDKIDVVDRGAEGKVRVLCRGPYQWIPQGPLQKKLIRAYLDQVSSLIAVSPPPKSLQLPFELYLSKKTVKKMQDDLRSVFEKYRSFSRVEHETTPPHELVATSGLILLQDFDGWGNLLLRKNMNLFSSKSY